MLSVACRVSCIMYPPESLESTCVARRLRWAAPFIKAMLHAPCSLQIAVLYHPRLAVTSHVSEYREGRVASLSSKVDGAYSTMYVTCMRRTA